MTDDVETGPTAATFEEVQELGFFGTAVDPEPNESYTVQGVVAAATKAAAPAKTATTSTKTTSTSSSGSSSGS
jgi:hypothetical protein